VLSPLSLPDALPILLPLPASSDQPALDLSLLKDTSLCIFPFVKETGGNVADKQYLDAIQKTFFEVAKESPLLKDAVLLGDSLAKIGRATSELQSRSD